MGFNSGFKGLSHINPSHAFLSHIFETHFNIIRRRGVGISVYSVRSLLVSLMWTVHAARSPIRLLTPQDLDLERGVPGGCMTAPLPANSAIASSARTDCVLCACEHSKPKKTTCVQRRGSWLRWAVSWRLPCCGKLTSLPRLVLRPFPSRFSHFALMRRNIFCELIFVLSNKRLSSFIDYIIRSHAVTGFLCMQYPASFHGKKVSLE